MHSGELHETGLDTNNITSFMNILTDAKNNWTIETKDRISTLNTGAFLVSCWKIQGMDYVALKKQMSNKDTSITLSSSNITVLLLSKWDVHVYNMDMHGVPLGRPPSSIDINNVIANGTLLSGDLTITLINNVEQDIKQSLSSKKASEQKTVIEKQGKNEKNRVDAENRKKEEETLRKHERDELEREILKKIFP